MCDAWGEEIDFTNWPGLQFQLSVSDYAFPSSAREFRPGRFNQCLQVSHQLSKFKARYKKFKKKFQSLFFRYIVE